MQFAFEQTHCQSGIALLQGSLGPFQHGCQE
jgi:hypothetical protein